MLEEYRYCGKGERLGSVGVFFRLQYSQFFLMMEEKSIKYAIITRLHDYKQLSEVKFYFPQSSQNIFLWSFFLVPRREFLSCVSTSYFSHWSILIVVNTVTNILWQIIIDESRMFCCTMTFCYKRHIFASFCETASYSNRTHEKVFKNRNCSYLHFYVVFYL